MSGGGRRGRGGVVWDWRINEGGGGEDGGKEGERARWREGCGAKGVGGRRGGWEGRLGGRQGRQRAGRGNEGDICIGEREGTISGRTGRQSREIKHVINHCKKKRPDEPSLFMHVCFSPFPVELHKPTERVSIIHNMKISHFPRAIFTAVETALHF